MADIVRAIPASDPAVIRLFRFDRASIPDDEDERLLWLADRWLELDEWIDSHLTERRTRHEPLAA